MKDTAGGKSSRPAGETNIREVRRHMPFGRPGGGIRGLKQPPAKVKDFKGTVKRLLTYLKPYKLQFLLIFIMAALSTLFNIVSPKIMGQATTELFEGMMQRLQGVPGAGVDFGFIKYILITLGVLYLISAVFSYLQQFIMAGVVQKIVYDMRKDINDKLTRLPLKYFDAHAHGEILSRVTNDVDNISSTMQQSITQLVTASVMLIGIIVMMLSISPIMTLLVCLLILPLSFIVTKFIAGRSQKYFVGQQAVLGELNGHVEEMYGGHVIVKAFGRERQSIEKFNEINERLYETGWKAQFLSGLIMPLMHLINNLGYVLVCVVGAIFVMRRAIQIGDVQAFMQYATHFTHPITQTASIANIFQSIAASAERVFEILDEPEEKPDKADAKVLEFPRGDVRFQNVKFSYQ